MGQHLFIVSRQQPDLYSYLTREFSGEPDVQVILDRRHADRRSRNGGSRLEHGERRHGQRREKPDVSGQLSTLGYAFVRIE